MCPLCLRSSRRVSVRSEEVTVLRDCPVTLSSPSLASVTLIQKSALGVGCGRELVGFSSPGWRGVREGWGVRELGGGGSWDGAAAKHRRYDWRHARNDLKDTLDTTHKQTQDEIHTHNEHMHRTKHHKWKTSWCVRGTWVKCGSFLDLSIKEKCQKPKHCLNNSGLVEF